MGPSLAAAANYMADFGELAAIAPAATAVGIVLTLRRQRPMALAWFIGLGCTIAAVALLKAAHLPVSGHAAVAMAFEGGLAVLMWRDALGLRAGHRLVSIGLWSIAAAVCVSVWLLRWHSAADVAVGITLGLMSSAALARTPLGTRAGRARHGIAGLAAVAVLIGVLHGVRITDPIAHRLRFELQRAMFGIGTAAARSR